MKKILIAAALLVSVAAIKATGGDRTKQFNDNSYTAVYNDTVPTDTSKKDTARFSLAGYNVTDTVPKDTTKKDTMFAPSFAYNVKDTVPADTTKKDTTFQYMAFAR